MTGMIATRTYPIGKCLLVRRADYVTYIKPTATTGTGLFSTVLISTAISAGTYITLVASPATTPSSVSARYIALSVTSQTHSPLTFVEIFDPYNKCFFWGLIMSIFGGLIILTISVSLIRSAFRRAKRRPLILPDAMPAGTIHELNSVSFLSPRSPSDFLPSSQRRVDLGGAKSHLHEPKGYPPVPPPKRHLTVQPSWSAGGQHSHAPESRASPCSEGTYSQTFALPIFPNRPDVDGVSLVRPKPPHFRTNSASSTGSTYSVSSPPPFQSLSTSGSRYSAQDVLQWYGHSRGSVPSSNGVRPPPPVRPYPRSVQAQMVAEHRVSLAGRSSYVPTAPLRVTERAATLQFGMNKSPVQYSGRRSNSCDDLYIGNSVISEVEQKAPMPRRSTTTVRDMPLKYIHRARATAQEYLYKNPIISHSPTRSAASGFIGPPPLAY